MAVDPRHAPASHPQRSPQRSPSSAMQADHEVAIIGGGLCGLALAHSLHARGVDWCLYEGRERLGGRILTETSGHGAALDLGPSWFWPDTQPSITRLVADLGLETLPQPDDGRVRLLDDPNEPPRDKDAGTRGGLHAGARRLAQGMAALVQALSAPLPAARLRTGAILGRVAHAGDHVRLRFTDGREATAGHVVMALPPRLVAQVAFDPPLPPDLRAALDAAPTWMATAAKAGVALPQAPWRDEPNRGNAWVTHPQAVLAETWDAGTAETPALAGFVALGAEGRVQYRRGLPLLIDSQLTMLFGPDASNGELHLADWAEQPLTCSARDRAEDGARPDHAAYGDARLLRPAWDGRLWFGGSETATRGGGYLEGALQAAARLRRDVVEALRAPHVPAASA